MTFTEAEAIFRDIVEATRGSEDLRPLHHGLVLSAIRYARFRTDWRLADIETRRAMDGPRRLAHDAFIDSCNILSRACARAGRPNEWRRRIGDDRKEIGDFACHAHAVLGISAR